MGIKSHLVDGKQAIDAQERALTFVEQVTFAKVLSYAKSDQSAAAGTTPNQAVLQDVPLGQQLKPLHLEVLEINGNALPVITQQLQDGKNIIFHEIAYVLGKEQLVLGFR